LACQILIDREEFHRVSTLCALLLETAELDYSQEDVAHLHRLLGIALFHTEAYQQALVQVRSAREHFENLRAWSGMAETLRMEGEVQACLGDLNSANTSYRKALELYRTVADSPLGRAECLYQIGINERRNGNSEAAMKCWRESLGIRQDLKDVHGVADCIQEIGRVHAEHDQLSEARAHVEHALLLYERAGATASRMAALGTLGDLYNRAGRVEEACAVYREALSFWEERQHSRWTAVFRQRLQRSSNPLYRCGHAPA
jgi:tetratricopeptide (TPR) repeat protein